ncbi:hypothetical protein L7F22_046540 [Adiantum nelumboides]|nr:hypothetical protein [Adiantum nelumboides]
MLKLHFWSLFRTYYAPVSRVLAFFHACCAAAVLRTLAVLLKVVATPLQITLECCSSGLCCCRLLEIVVALPQTVIELLESTEGCSCRRYRAAADYSKLLLHCPRLLLRYCKVLKNILAKVKVAGVGGGDAAGGSRTVQSYCDERGAAWFWRRESPGRNEAIVGGG